jgi:hypothetical protein
MRLFKNCELAVGVPLAVLILVATGCGSVDGSGGEVATDPVGDVQTQADSLRFRQRHPRPPGTGGAPSATGGAPSTTGGSTSTGGSATVDCSICTIAQECCEAVGAPCTFSADACFALDPGREKTYATYCLTTLRTTISAWTISGATPPAVCHLPF